MQNTMGETATEATFQKQILNKLDKVEKTMNQILEYIEDSKLSEDDKKALLAALEEGKVGRLLSKKQVFG